MDDAHSLWHRTRRRLYRRRHVSGAMDPRERQARCPRREPRKCRRACRRLRRRTPRLVACSAMALPVTFADARADPRSELRWATFSLVACCGGILLMIRSMEFGRQGPAQRDAILWGTIAGLAAAKSIGWIATRRPPAPFALTTSLVTHLGLIAWAMRPAGNAAQHAPAPTPPRLEPVEISLPPAATRASLPAEDRAPSTTVESVAPAGEAPNSKSSEHLHEVRRELKKVVRERRRHMLRTEKAALVAFAKRAGATAGLVGAETSSCSGGEIPCLTICDAGVIGNASAAGVTLLIRRFILPTLASSAMLAPRTDSQLPATVTQGIASN
jgi:hypothetical protein